MNERRPLVLPMPHEGDSADRRARLFVAALVAPASVVLLSEPTTLRVVVGVAGLLVSVAYVARSRAAKRSVVDERLTLDAQGLSLHEARGERSARWDEVLALDLAPDAATLLVEVRDAEPIAIAPGFGGLGTVALHELLLRYRHGANADDRG